MTDYPDDASAALDKAIEEFTAKHGRTPKNHERKDLQWRIFAKMENPDLTWDEDEDPNA